MIEQTFTVVGMTCDHCVRAVSAELSKLDGVERVSVDLASGRVSVESTALLPPADVAAAIDEAGYEVAP
jgi:copper chaperone